MIGCWRLRAPASYRARLEIQQSSASETMSVYGCHWAMFFQSSRNFSIIAYQGQTATKSFATRATLAMLGADDQGATLSDAGARLRKMSKHDLQARMSSAITVLAQCFRLVESLHSNHRLGISRPG